MNEVISIAEAARQLDVNRATLRRWIEKCPALRVAPQRYKGKWFVDVDACKRFSAECRIADLKCAREKLVACMRRCNVGIEEYDRWIARVEEEPRL